MKTRDDLARYFAELGFTTGAEIGVHEGTYSKILLEANPDLNLVCVDLWERKGGKEQIARDNLTGYPNVSFRKGYSTEIAKDYSDEQFDFVYIDAAHDFDNVMSDLLAWGKKVRRGGIISGHDYANNRNCGVEDAVNIYAKWHGLTVSVLEEPNETWTPKYPNENNRLVGLSWWLQK